MHRQSIPITDVIILDRQRELDLSHVASLAQSIKELGLIQPIVINQDKRLIAGGHRLAACKMLGLQMIDFVYRETLSEDELQEMELTENVKRMDNRWQDTCLAIAKIHFLKVKKNALDSKTWGHRDTGAFLNINQAKVSYSLIVARELLLDDTKQGPFWKADTFTDAYGLLMQRDTDAAVKLLATSQGQQTFNAVDCFTFTEPKNNPFTLTETTQSDRDVDEEIRILRDKEDFDLFYTAINNNPKYKNRIFAHWSHANPKKSREEFDKLWSTRTDKDLYWHYRSLEKVVINLSNQYIWTDSIRFMCANPSTFDHIITDIPFGIDIEMIDQTSSIKGIDSIKAEHTVEGNEELHAQFFPAAFVTLKDNAFLITWCDMMQWDRMYHLAVAAGFKVQRWPIIWDKIYPCLNQMAQYNFTKSFEIAMVCRKGNITLPQKQSDCIIHTGKDSLSDGHPFAKPYLLWERLITAVSIEGQSILDPFAGSGSCLKSGIKLKRIMTGIEKDEQLYYNGIESMKQFYLSLDVTATFA